MSDKFEHNIKEYIWGTEDWIYQDEDVLIKIIDAKTPLSVQVHPDDEYARIHENGSKGKNECWYLLDAAPGAFLYCGVKAPCTRDGLEKAALDGTLTDYLVRYDVKKGDVINIPAGTIHAIGGGCKILEVQQSSTITYRMYDYGRLGADGRPRELHLRKALDVARLTPAPALGALPLSTKYFAIAKEGGAIRVIWPKGASGGCGSFNFPL